ncbi:MAG: thioesterase family protein [Emergencia sp.]
MLEAGIRGNQEVRVSEANSAKTMGSGTLDVFATPAMIALMEETAWRSVAEHLEEGEGTVGTKLDVSHVAATPLGMTVRCESELTEADGRRLVFKVAAYDEAGLIGEGTHERFIIRNEKFQAKANGKLTGK